MTARIIHGLCTLSAVLIIIGAAMASQENTESKRALNYALLDACDHGDLDEVRRLLGRGADINARGLFDSTPLMRASSRGHAHVVQELISRGADVNARSWKGATALMDAARWSENAEVIKVLLDRKGYVNAVDEDGSTALMDAARRGSLDFVTILFERKADIHAADKRGITALGTAAAENRRSVVEFLRKHGAAYDIHSAAAVGDLNELKRYASNGGDVSVRDKPYGRSLLWWASKNGHLEVVGWLLDRKVDMEARGPNGETSLHAAAMSGHHEVVALLLDKGADIQAYSEGMEGTALHFACLHGRLKTVELLLDRGCSIETPTKAGGELPLMIASQSGKTEIVRMLLKRGAKIDAVDRKGKTALLKAARFLQVETVRVLLDAGADVQRQDAEDHYTALHYACCPGEGCPEEAARTAELLIHKGAKVDRPDVDGLYPLDCAAGAGCKDLVALLVPRIRSVRDFQVHLSRALLFSVSEGYFNEDVASRLLEAGASVNCKGPEGYTPLMYAVELGDVTAVKFFVSNGADAEAKNAEGDTALDIALQGRRKHIIEVLTSRKQ